MKGALRGAAETTDRPDIRESLARAVASAVAELGGFSFDEAREDYLASTDSLIAEMGRHGLVVVRASRGAAGLAGEDVAARVGAGDVVEPLEGPRTGAEGHIGGVAGMVSSRGTKNGGGP